MEYLRQLRMERPLLYWVGVAVVFWLAFQLALYLVALVIGPFGLPPYLSIVVLVGILVLVARRQQR
jgi:hypothetical protein